MICYRKGVVVLPEAIPTGALLEELSQRWVSLT